MKKLLALLLTASLALSLASCGTQEETSVGNNSGEETSVGNNSGEEASVENNNGEDTDSSTENSQNEMDSSQEDIFENLYYNIGVVESSLDGNRMIHDIRVYNQSNSYIDGIFEFVFTDDETGQIYKCGVPVSGLGPDDFDFETFWLPMGIYDENNPEVSINVIRMDVSENLNFSQEITEENINQYIYTNYDIGPVIDNQYTITADVNNCTFQYFSGDVTVNVYGSDGELVVSRSKSITNSDPGSVEPIVLMADLSNNYTFETVIENFEFTKNPKA